jgi:hypothetical protein
MTVCHPDQVILESLGNAIAAILTRAIGHSSAMGIGSQS